MNSEGTLKVLNNSSGERKEGRRRKEGRKKEERKEGKKKRRNYRPVPGYSLLHTTPPPP